MKEINKEAEWKAEDDARALIEYQKIKQDKDRFNKAMKKLKEKAKEVKDTLKEI